jgi:hypothetical protein
VNNKSNFGDNCGKVRCGISESRSVVAAPTATAADQSAVGIGEWGGGKRFSQDWVGRASHASQSAKFEYRLE